MRGKPGRYLIVGSSWFENSTRLPMASSETWGLSVLLEREAAFHVVCSLTTCGAPVFLAFKLPPASRILFLNKG